MVQPPRKYSREERAAFVKDPARLEKEASLVELNQKQLKREAISCFKDSRNCSTKRKRNGNDDELSAVSADKRPTAIQDHNKLETSSH